jgi:glycine cleavage system regulatory protein
MSSDQIIVNVDALDTSDNYGDTTIVIPVKDPDRNDLLATITRFFRDRHRNIDAAKFDTAIKQKFEDPEDD